jgi:hypothetical protein
VVLTEPPFSVKPRTTEVLSELASPPPVPHGIIRVEHVAGLDDHGMAVAAYWAGVAAKPKEKITLQQGARVVMKNWTE